MQLDFDIRSFVRHIFNCSTRVHILLTGPYTWNGTLYVIVFFIWGDFTNSSPILVIFFSFCLYFQTASIYYTSEVSKTKTKVLARITLWVWSELKLNSACDN